MKVRQALSVAVAVGSALVGGGLGSQALEQANSAPLGSGARPTSHSSTLAATQAPRATARTGQHRRSTSQQA